MDKEFEIGGETVHGEVVERVNIADMPLVTVPGCTHQSQSRKPSDEFPGCEEVTCNDCPLGWYVSASMTE